MESPLVYLTTTLYFLAQKTGLYSPGILPFLSMFTPFKLLGKLYINGEGDIHAIGILGRTHITKDYQIIGFTGFTIITPTGTVYLLGTALGVLLVLNPHAVNTIST